MAIFSYRALDTGGRMQTGTLEASAVAAVSEALQAKGWTPVDIGLEGSLRNGSCWTSRGRQRLRLEELVGLISQLATLLRAGLPLDRVLSTLQEADGTPLRSSTITELRDAVRGGSALSDAMTRLGAVFPPVVPAMVKAGEAGGVLPQVLQRLADHLSRSADFRRSVVNALIYPMILLGAVLISLGFLMAYVVPQFAEMYANLDAQLPWFSKAVLAVGLALRQGWMLLFAAIFGVVLLLNLWWKRPESRSTLERWLLGRRWIGTLLANVEAERYLRTLGTLLASGVAMLTALRISRGVISNSVFVAAATQAEESVRGGARLSDALAREPRFPRLPLQMARIGEEAGELDGMLLQAADTLAVDVRTRLDRALAALLPVVTVLMFLLIGAVVMSILVPLYDLTSVIG